MRKENDGLMMFSSKYEICSREFELDFKPNEEFANYEKTDLLERRNLFWIGYAIHRRYPFTTVVLYCTIIILSRRA